MDRGVRTFLCVHKQLLQTHTGCVQVLSPQAGGDRHSQLCEIHMRQLRDHCIRGAIIKVGDRRVAWFFFSSILFFLLCGTHDFDYSLIIEVGILVLPRGIKTVLLGIFLCTGLRGPHGVKHTGTIIRAPNGTHGFYRFSDDKRGDGWPGFSVQQNSICLLCGIHDFDRS